MDKDDEEKQTNLEDEKQFLVSVDDTLKTVEKSIHKFVTDVPQALVNCGLDIDLKKLNIEDGQNIQDLISSFPKSFNDLINKGTHTVCFLFKRKQ